MTNSAKKSKTIHKKNKFAIGFTVYMALLSVIMIGCLSLLWFRMDAYEKSRPDNRIAELVSEADSSFWREFLMEQGLSARYVDTLDLETVSFYKKMDLYTEAVPTYGIRFGDTEVLVARLRSGEALSFGYHTWEPDSICLAESKLCLYIPQNAVILVNGAPIGTKYPVWENAQALQLGVFDENRADAPHLDKYELNDIYEPDGITVEDDNGNALVLSYTAGSSYYYVPYMSDYTITVPTGCTVMINGILLTEDNARLETSPHKDFEGIEDFVPFVPGQTTYTIEGLVMPPEVQVLSENGETMECTIEDTAYVCEIGDTPSDTLSAYILTVFDAYMAYSGNRGQDLSANYSRYVSYLVPGSEAADRAAQARTSIQWAKDSKTSSVSLSAYTPYSEDLFTCQVDFVLADDSAAGNTNSYLFIFVKYNGAWKVVRVLNKTAFF